MAITVIGAAAEKAMLQDVPLGRLYRFESGVGPLVCMNVGRPMVVVLGGGGAPAGSFNAEVHQDTGVLVLPADLELELLPGNDGVFGLAVPSQTQNGSMLVLDGEAWIRVADGPATSIYNISTGIREHPPAAARAFNSWRLCWRNHLGEAIEIVRNG